MTIKVVLVPVTATETGASTLKTAFALGHRFSAHVAALHVRADPRNTMPYMGEGMSGIVLQEIMAAIERDAAERARAARALFDAGVAEFAVPLADAPEAAPRFSANWREEVGREDEIVARYARLSDVVVIGSQSARQSTVVDMMMEAVLLDGGRPVLLAPAQVPNSFGDNIAVAWNGSVEAARAVAAGMPFIKAARRVTILTIGEGSEPQATAEALKRYLAWHGIDAAPLVATAAAEGAGPAILGQTKRLGADLLITGAYTHNRFRQMIFGGVTRHILSDAELPVLVAH